MPSFPPRFPDARTSCQTNRDALLPPRWPVGTDAVATLVESLPPSQVSRFSFFFFSFLWHSYPQSDGVKSQCFLNVFCPSPQNCLIALTSVLGATRRTWWANPSPPLAPHLRPRTEPCQPMSASFHAVAQVKFTWLGLESDPSRESDDKMTLVQFTRDFSGTLGFLTNNLKDSGSPNI